MSDNKNFFKKQTDSSRVKAAIISEYFPQFCHIISRRHTPQRFGYFDMFAGPGIYEDESWSTPLLIAKNCYEDSFLRDKVWMVFNDMAFGDKLKENFEKFFESGTFIYEPYFASRVFGEWPKIDTFLTRNTMQGFYNECPTVLFIDPWGYKHINTRVLTQFLTQWGNEVFIFINTKRLNAAFENELFQEDLKIVFPLTYNEVRENKKLLGSVEERHKYIIKDYANIKYDDIVSNKKIIEKILNKVFFNEYKEWMKVVITLININKHLDEDVDEEDIQEWREFKDESDN